jgi:hypothetical protein
MRGGARGGGRGGKRGAEEDERSRRVRQREEDDALLRSTDEAAISAAVVELEKQVARLKGDELERASKRLQVLVVRRAQLRAKRERQERNQEQAEAPGAGAGDAPEFAIVDGRKVLVGGSGAVPLPSATSLRAPPEPQWPPLPARRVPPPPPRPPGGSAPPPLRTVPPAPLSDFARARREMDEEKEAKAREDVERAASAAALAAKDDHPAYEQRAGAGVLDTLQRQLQQRHHAP